VSDLVVYRNGTWLASTRRDGRPQFRLRGDAGDVPLLGDTDGEGGFDLVMSRGPGCTAVARNISPSINRQTLTGEVVDGAGRRNQFGRVVRVRPDAAPGVTLTRAVDGGSGMLAQTPYPLVVPTPWAGTHRVEVRFAAGTVAFAMNPGERVRVYADGMTLRY
jgi:hypothetical protein